MKIRKLAGAVAALMLAFPVAASAQVQIGPQLLYGGDWDLGIGGRLLVNVESLEHWDFVGEFDVWFPDDSPNVDRSAWEINGNLAYNFQIEDAESIFPYVGGGLNIFHRSFESVDDPGNDFDDTDLGLNLFGGTKFRGDSFTPFVEVRAVVEGADQVVITGGILF